MGLASAALFAQAPPAPGASPRIDAIKKSGELRVAVLQNSAVAAGKHHRQRPGLERPGLDAGQ
jgi:hypothetical protein